MVSLETKLQNVNLQAASRVKRSTPRRILKTYTTVLPDPPIFADALFAFGGFPTAHILDSHYDRQAAFIG